MAKFSINSRIGYTSTMFTFDATESIDPDGESIVLRARWDFNDNGQWDTDFSSNLKTNWIFNGSGKYTIRLEVKDPDGLTDQVIDSLEVLGPYEDSLITDPRDNQVYRIINIKGIWFFAENLRYGIWKQSTANQTDNDTAEYFAFNDDTTNIPLYGGLYSWDEAMNWKEQHFNQGVCPPGWRIPEMDDWLQVNIMFPYRLIAQYYGPEGISGFNLRFGGCYLSGKKDLPFFSGSGFTSKDSNGWYWFNSKSYSFGKYYYGILSFNNPDLSSEFRRVNGLDIHKSTLDYLNNNNEIVHVDCFYSVRCVKND